MTKQKQIRKEINPRYQQNKDKSARSFIGTVGTNCTKKTGETRYVEWRKQETRCNICGGNP